jgi:hypothetical protein
MVLLGVSNAVSPDFRMITSNQGRLLHPSGALALEVRRGIDLAEIAD